MADDKVGRSLASNKKIERDYQTVRARQSGPAKAQRSPTKGYQGLLRGEYKDFDWNRKPPGRRGKRAMKRYRRGRKGRGSNSR